ncbi:hypothetical protein DFH27DRAFT_640041 [Peziza echinospora]|nr:hypothetical protein DFH27DRAFT_640041 [Peziza echinospora]
MYSTKLNEHSWPRMTATRTHGMCIDRPMCTRRCRLQARANRQLPKAGKCIYLPNTPLAIPASSLGAFVHRALASSPGVINRAWPRIDSGLGEDSLPSTMHSGHLQGSPTHTDAQPSPVTFSSSGGALRPAESHCKVVWTCFYSLYCFPSNVLPDSQSCHASTCYVLSDSFRLSISKATTTPKNRLIVKRLEENKIRDTWAGIFQMFDLHPETTHRSPAACRYVSFEASRLRRQPSLRPGILPQLRGHFHVKDRPSVERARGHAQDSVFEGWAVCMYAMATSMMWLLSWPRSNSIPRAFRWA